MLDIARVNAAGIDGVTCDPCVPTRGQETWSRAGLLSLYSESSSITQTGCACFMVMLLGHLDFIDNSQHAGHALATAGRKLLLVKSVDAPFDHRRSAVNFNFETLEARPAIVTKGFHNAAAQVAARSVLLCQAIHDDFSCSSVTRMSLARARPS